MNDFLLDVGFGFIPGYARVTALGNNPDIDVAPEDVWSGGGTYPWMTASTSLEVVSTSAADAAAGTGARTVTISGLDINYLPISQTVTLNGLTPVPLPTQMFRINSAVVVTSGSGAVNAGDISVRDAGAGTTRAHIPLGYGITRQSQYTVPSGNTLSIVSFILSINRPSSVRDATVAVFVKSPNGTYRMPIEITVDGNPYRHDGIPGIIVAEKFDVQFRCTNVSATNTDLTAGFLGVLRKDR